MILISGGSGSGKSACAERIALEKGGERTLIYIATMQVCDAEGEAKVRRHKKLREGKDFTVLEQSRDIAKAVPRIEEKNSVVLLECMSNLAANEMFDGPFCGVERTAEKITAELCELEQAAGELIVVTNNVFEDGNCYDFETAEYQKALGEINRTLAMRSELVVEVVAGIPVVVKGQL